MIAIPEPAYRPYETITLLIDMVYHQPSSEQVKTGSTAPTVFARTGNIMLMPLCPELAPQRLEAVIESGVQLNEHFSWCSLPYDNDQNSQYIRNIQDQQAEKQALCLAVLHATCKTYLGEVGVDWVDPQLNCLNLVYWIRTNQQNKGYATAAVRLLLQVAQRFYSVQYAEIRMTTANEASRKVAEKLGANYGYVTKNAVTAKGDCKDVFCFSLPLL